VPQVAFVTATASGSSGVAVVNTPPPVAAAVTPTSTYIPATVNTATATYQPEMVTTNAAVANVVGQSSFGPVMFVLGLFAMAM
jgi:hypothetical protein